MPSYFTPTVSVASSIGKLRYALVPNGVLPDGNYTIVISPGIAYDAAGNQELTGGTFTFRILTGDANGDGVVGFDDLLVVAQNYGQSGRTFAQGNFNYDAAGQVNFDDLLIIAQKYGTSLLLAPAPDSPQTLRSEKRSRPVDDI